MPSKEEEAAALMKSAKKHHTKTLTKWSADWDSAASDYEKAAKIYVHLNAIKNAREAYNLAATAHEKAENLYHSAKMLEGLADYLKEQREFMATTEGQAEAMDCYLKASRVYALDRKPDRQADALNRAAKITPASKVKDATKLILEAIDALEDYEKQHLTLDLYRSCLLMQIRSEAFLDAIQLEMRQIKMFEKLQQPSNAAKAGLEVVVMALYMGDWVLADRYFRDLQNNYGFPHTKEQSAAFELLHAVEEREQELLDEAAKNSTLSFLLPDVSRMAKKITLSGSNAPAKKAAAAAAAAAGGAAPAPVEDDEEDLR